VGSSTLSILSPPGIARGPTWWPGLSAGDRRPSFRCGRHSEQANDLRTAIESRHSEGLGSRGPCGRTIDGLALRKGVHDELDRTKSSLAVEDPARVSDSRCTSEEKGRKPVCLHGGGPRRSSNTPLYRRSFHAMLTGAGRFLGRASGRRTRRSRPPEPAVEAWGGTFLPDNPIAHGYA